MNDLLIGGVTLDLSPDTAILPSFQVSDLLKPDTIQSDFSPEVSVPGTSKNHQLLGQAAYDGNAAGIPYKSLANVTLRSEGVEIMPRARLLLKGYQNGQYQLQLVAGNKRFVEALGDKTLSDLDFSRFTHARTISAIADRASAAYAAANGWSYELYDRGRPLDPANLSPYDLWPTLSAALVLEQLASEAGFVVDYPAEGLLPRLQVPAVAPAEYSEAFRKARRLRVGLGPGHEDDGAPDSNRSDVVKTIPFDDDTRPIGTVPALVPTVAGVYDSTSFSYTADQAVYVQVQARTVVQIVYSSVRLGKAQARVELHINGRKVEQKVNDKEVVNSAWVEATNEDPFSVGATAERLLLKPGDQLTAVLRLSGVGNAPIDKWGFKIFQDVAFGNAGVGLPVDKFDVTVLPEQPPGAQVNIAEWLPQDMKQLDFFKALVQVCGFSVQTDAYEDRLTLHPSRAVLDNVPYARDWTAKRDAPDLPAGQARSVSYRFGGFGQQNLFQWAEDESGTKGFGNGTLVVADKTLPATYTMTTLPFAASEPSQALPGLLLIQNYKLRENEDPFAEPEYDTASPKPRLTLRSTDTQNISLVEGAVRRAVVAPLSYFAQEEDGLSLDAEGYILPVAWAGLGAMLTEMRFHKERYRFSPRDIAEFLAEPNIPIWDGVLGGWFSISKINEFTSTRSVEVEMLRLHPSFLVAPEPGVRREFAGSEFAQPEFYVSDTV
ncbi:hypothetical protein [Hymenobacter glacieicola]|uniref:Uncharacterized protein n=1 Tax=Hymenobacter glacieicola TaxID=1562124 RepID=A0ABQ1WJY9_9BACT|nr:hypothetical protein [Hymenobacter glacieicola]GGG34157.1 hypothetical protein GCM10011378_08220 [Hymenobacter glacieicola]